MEKMSNNQKLQKMAMAVVAVLMVVCLCAGLFVEFGSSLFYTKKTDKKDALEVTSETVKYTEDKEVISEKNEELLTRPTGGKDGYVILEIAPNKTYQAWGYFIGGMEPNKDVLEKIANDQGTAGASNGLIGEGYSTPLQKIENGNRYEFFESKNSQKYQLVADGKSKKDGGYEIINATLEGDYTGFFEYVGPKKGLYMLTKNPVEEVVAKRGGSYKANFERKDLYTASAITDLGWNSDDSIVLTGYNYDGTLVYESSVDKGYFVTEATVIPTEDYGKYHEYDEYVIDWEKTIPNFSTSGTGSGSTVSGGDVSGGDVSGSDVSGGDVSGGDVSGGDVSGGDVSGGDVSGGDELADVKALINAAVQRGDFSHVIFKPFDENASNSVSDNRYKLTFKYSIENVNEPIYFVSEDTLKFNPGRGDFCAKLEIINGSYYTETQNGDGEYEIYVKDFEMTPRKAGETNSDILNKCCWVWHPTSLEEGKEHSTLKEYNEGKGILYTTSISAALKEIRFKDFDDNKKSKTGKCKAFYCRNTYKNNEWFKILCLGINGYTGASNQNPVDFLTASDAKDKIKEFDKATKIEIRTKEPSEVTDQDIDDADFIYVTNVLPMEALAGFGCVTEEAFKNDLASFKMAKRIYLECMNKNKAVMINANLAHEPQKNLCKMYQLFTIFKDPSVMRNFLMQEDLYGNSHVIEKNGLNYIDDDGYYVYRYTKNKWCKKDSSMLFEYDNTTPTKVYDWNYTDKYWKVYEAHNECCTGEGLKHNDGRYKNSWTMQNDDNTYVNKPSDRWLIGQWYGAGFLQQIGKMKDIYQILRQDIFRLAITNSSLNTRQEAVIYVDEFDETYPIFYHMTAVAVLCDLPDIKRVQIFYDSNGDGLIDDPQKPVPFWEAIADGETPTEGCQNVTSDLNALELNYVNPSKVYKGYDVDVKSFFGENDREKCFIVKVMGIKNGGTKEVPYMIPVVEEKAVTVIIRDMFELN